MSAKIQARIASRGWTWEHVIAMCDYCALSLKLGAGRHHTGWYMGNIIDGYTRGLYGLATDNYRFVSDGSISPDDIPLWSVAAKSAPRTEITIEHGSPKRAFSYMVYDDYYLKGTLTKQTLDDLIAKHWKLAVITKEENGRLNSNGLRNTMLESSEARWAVAKIRFSGVGQARELIESKGLGHTSMSAGDVVVTYGQPFVAGQ